MATVFAAILTLLVIVGSSFRAESFPQGCRKLVGSREDHIPGQFVVKMSRGVSTQAVVQLMLEMATSNCARMMYRTSNTSDASEEPITCSGMIYMGYFGFAAKMSDAALMWLCDKESVEYIEPSYVITLPTQPPTVPITEAIGSGESPGTEVFPVSIQPTATTGGSVTSHIYSSVKIAPVATNQVVPTTAPTKVRCSKLHGDLLPVNNYLVMFQPHLPQLRLHELLRLLRSITEVDENFDMKRMKPTFRGPAKGFYYNGLNREAIMKLCGSDMIDYIQVQEDASSSLMPQPTNNPNAKPAPTTVASTTSVSATPTPVVCDKLMKYDDNTEIISNRYVIMLKKDTSPTDINGLITQLRNFMNPGSHNSIQVKELRPAERLKMITVETNQAGLEWICQNEHVRIIDYDRHMSIANPAPTTVAVASTSVSATPTPVVCDKLVKYNDNTGIIPNRYILMLKKYTSQTDMNNLITQLKNLMNSGSHSSIQVKKVHLAKEAKMITVEINQAGLEWVCQNTNVDKIDPDKEMMIGPNPTQPEPSQTSQRKCDKLRGTLPQSGVSHCRIYMKKTSKRQDCDQFIKHMEEMKKSSSTLQFTVTRVSHHKQHPVIKAELNLDAINEICRSDEIESIRIIS